MKKSEGKRYEADADIEFKYSVDTDIEFGVFTDSGEKKNVQKYKAHCRNISVEGMSFVSDQKLDKGDHLVLDVYLPAENSPVHMEGTVCWSKSDVKEEKDNSFCTGVFLTTVEGKEVRETVYFDEDYQVDWSEVLESVLGKYRHIVRDREIR